VNRDDMAKIDTIAAVCGAVGNGNLVDAALILERDYTFAPEAVTKRRFSPLSYTRVFIRDGFVDRYCGERLVFPAVLRVLSHALPDKFPYHPNWRTAMTHPAYWEIGATIDHQVPVTRGGADDASNWVTTSMARNSAKMNWSLAEIGWKLHPPGDFRVWDGLLPWCVEYSNRHPEVITDSGLRQWLRAGSTALAETRHAV